MTTLAINTLDNTITQKLHIERSSILLGCRIPIIKVGILTDGNLTITLKLNDTQIHQQSITYQELNELGLYWQGMKAFQFPHPISLRKVNRTSLFDLDIEISTTCTMSGSIYLGLVKEPHPVRVANPGVDFGDNPNRDIWTNPYKIDLVVYK